MVKKDSHRYPDWFSGFMTEAMQFAHAKKDHGLLEAGLGIARQLHLGNVREARRLYEVARPQLISLRMFAGQGGETDSTQLISMLRSRLYPRSVRKDILQGLRLAHPAKSRRVMRP